MSLITLILFPFIGSLIAAIMPANARNSESTLAGLIALGCAIQTALYFPEITNGGVIYQEIPWISALNLNLMIRMDGFAWLFSMLILGIGSLVVLYARYYMSPSDPVPRFFSFFLAFMGSMMGVVLSGNLIQIALFWELTSLFSFLLIGYWYHNKEARRGARMALTVTGTGGLCLFAGVLILGHIVGSYDLDTVLAAGDLVRNHPLYLPTLILILLGAFTKSAQFPFHFWLPHAMAAPTPVSAYLHSATMVKAGVFLLARLWPVLAGSNEWFWIVSSVGLCTLLLGAYVAMFQNDLKGLLAYSTISHLGLITLLLGLNSPLAAVAAVFHIMNHATFKASLFMAAGIIDHETGTRDIRKLSGLYRVMPITGTLAMVASAAMAGVPLLNGFLSKEMFFSETIFLNAAPIVEWGLPIAATIAGIFSVAYALRFTVDVFWGPATTDLPNPHPHEPPRWMRVPVDLLVVICLIVGIAPAFSVKHMLEAAATPVTGGTLPEFSLAIWHGFNLPFVMSLIAMAGGIACYFLLRGHLSSARHLRTPFTHYFDGRRFFEKTLTILGWLSRASVRIFSTNKLQPQLVLLVMATIMVATIPLWIGTSLQTGTRELLPFSPTFALLWVVGCVCAIGAAQAAKHHRLKALTMAGGAGLCCCITFAWFSAPDLALTQLTVEIITMVLILLGLRWLPHRKNKHKVIIKVGMISRRLRDAGIALGAGAGMSALAWAIMTRPFPQSISNYFLERALPEGGGTNVVNVMLVDFRGFDTFGEVVVLGVVALTVYALLRRFRPASETMDIPRQQRELPADTQTDLINPRHARDTAIGYLMVPAVLVRFLLPLAATVGIYLFMRGHNAPGGGFVAGLVLSIALLLQYIVSGTEWVEAHLRLYPRYWIGAGLLTVIATGLGSLFWGYPFLTSHTAHLTVPVLGDIHIASALFFDIGVFTLVVGATLLILTALAHQSIRSHRYAERADALENNQEQERSH